MPRLVLDLTDLHRATREAQKFFRRLEREPLRFVKRAAEHEKATHAYVNRTGRLEASTQGFSLAGTLEGEFDVILRADMFYASYVNNLGYMTIDQSAVRVVLQLDALVAQGSALLGR